MLFNFYSDYLFDVQKFFERCIGDHNMVFISWLRARFTTYAQGVKLQIFVSVRWL